MSTLNAMSAAFSLPLSLACLLLAAPARAQAPRPPVDGSWERVRASGVLRWGADPDGGAPFLFFDANDTDKMLGFELDIMNGLSARLGVKAQLVRAQWSFLADDLFAGRSDLVMNGIEIKPERERVMSFSKPYLSYEQQLAVREADQGRYRTLDDLKGKPVSILKGAEAYNVLKRAGWTDDLIDQLQDSQTPYDDLLNKKVEAVLQEDLITRYYASKRPGVHIVPKTFSPGRYGVAFRKEERALREKVDAALERMKKDGELAAIYRKWGLRDASLPEDDAPAAAPASAESVLAQMLKATGYTLALTALSMPLALAFGLVLALMRLSDRAWLSWPAVCYIELMRGTPLIVQVFLIYFSLPVLGASLGTDLLTWPKFFVGVFCLTLNYAAYEAEIHRAGIQAVDKGQREAADSIGLGGAQAFFLVVLPQALRIIVPPVINDLISMLKDSSIVSVIGVAELLCVAQALGRSSATMAQMLVVAAVFYLLLSLACGSLGKWVEGKLKVQEAPELKLDRAHGH